MSILEVEKRKVESILMNRKEKEKTREIRSTLHKLNPNKSPCQVH